MVVFPVLPLTLVYLDCILPLLKVPCRVSLFVVILLVDPQGSTDTDCLFASLIVTQFIYFKRLFLRVESLCVNLEVGLLLRPLGTSVARVSLVGSWILSMGAHGG